MTTRATVRLMGAIMMLHTADFVFAQRRPTSIPDNVSCARCTIQAIRTASFGDTAGPGEIVQFPSVIERDGRGRFWVIERGVPKVYSADGRFIKEAGRSGGGPGEFRAAIELVALPGDSTLVIDGPLARGTIYGPDLAMRRTVRLTGLSPQPAIVIRWPVIWGNGSTSNTAGAGRTLHAMSLASAEAVVLRSFDTREGNVRSSPYDAISQLLSPPRSNSVWTANRLVYQLTQWDMAGNTLHQFVRTPKWFSKPSMPWSGNFTTPPPPFVRAIHEDSDGLVWVYVSVPGPDWEHAWDRVRATPAIEYPTSQINTEKLWVTTVEVIDPRARRVVARTTLDSFVAGVMADGTAWSQVSDDDGRRRIQLTQLNLIRAEGRQPFSQSRRAPLFSAAQTQIRPGAAKSR